MMGPDDEPPQFRIAVTERGKPTRFTKVRFRRTGGRYDGEQYVQFGSVAVRDVDFTGLGFESFDADGTIFQRCDFSRSSLAGMFGPTRRTVFEDCDFTAARLGNVLPGQARFERCLFSGTGLRSWRAVATEFIGCRFDGSFTDVKFWGAPWGRWLEKGTLRPPRRTNEFTENDFSGAELNDVGFVGGIDIDRQTMPVGPQYVRLERPTERIARARPIIQTWEPDEVRSEATVLLDVYSGYGFEEQQVLFANRWSTDVPREVADRVWALLAEIL